MTEQVRKVDVGKLVNTAASVIAALGGAGMLFMVLTGALSANSSNSHDLDQIKSQLTGMGAQIARLQDRIESGPRVDQLRELDRHMSQLDGRLDAYDSRLRSDEEGLTRVRTQMDGISASSGKLLPGERR